MSSRATRIVSGVVSPRWRVRLWMGGEILRHPGFYWQRWRLLVQSRPSASVRMARGARRVAKRQLPVGVDRLAAVLVVNLEARKDRLASIAAEMERLKIDNWTRFDAVYDPTGILGCSLSHAQCMRLMIERRWECMMVVEDDAKFRVDRAQLDLLVEEFLDDVSAEVACLGYSHEVVAPYNALFLRGLEVTTTPCYVLKSTIARDLAEVWDDGNRELARGGDRHIYGLDQVWKRLQRERVFLIPIKRAVYQGQSYSDVEQRVMSRLW